MMKKSTLSLPKLRCPKCGMWLGKDNLESVFVYCPQCRISYFEFELKEMLFKTKGGESMPVVNIPEEYLDARMVKTGDIITIAGPHIEKSAEETPFGRPTIEVPVILPNGTRVNYTINKTSLKRIMEAYGNNSDYWVGKKLKIELIKQNVRGQIKDVIYTYPITEEEETAQTQTTETTQTQQEAQATQTQTQTQEANK